MMCTTEAFGAITHSGGTKKLIKTGHLSQMEISDSCEVAKTPDRDVYELNTVNFATEQVSRYEIKQNKVQHEYLKSIT